MEKSPFELLVQQALLDTASLELAPALNGIDLAPPPMYSLRHLAWEKKLLANPFVFAKRRARPVWQRALRYAACVILALSVTFGGLMTFNPTARAWVQQIIAQWFGDYARFSFSGNAGQETGAWRTGYLPEGFELVSEAATDNMTVITYKNSTGILLEFTYTNKTRTSFGADSENHIREELLIGQNSGYLLRSNSMDVPCFLIWTDNLSGTAFRLVAEINSEALIKIAESVTPQS